MPPLRLILPVGCLALALLLSRLPDAHEPLDRESGRRTAALACKKDPEYYEARGVVSREEMFVTANGVELFTKVWAPRDRLVRGMVLYCHGYGDTIVHLWDDTAVSLAQSHFLVAGVDFPGFGLSQGLHGYIPSFDALVDCVVEYAEFLSSQHGLSSLPMFLLGESMGGAVAIKAHWRRPGLWQGAVLLAPMVKIAEEFYPPRPVLLLLRALGRVVPTWKLGPPRDAVQTGYKLPHKEKKAEENPVLYRDRVRLGTASAILDVMAEIQGKMHKVDLPLLILHGSGDRSTDPAMSRELYEAASSTDKQIQVYEGAWHELLRGEPNEVVEEVVGDIVRWLHHHTPEGLQDLGWSEEEVGLD